MTESVASRGTTTNTIRFAVVGAGAVGGYFGGRLAEANHAVTFIARGATLQALNSRGLRVESLKGDFEISPVDATDDPAAVGTVDVVLVAVKAWQVAELGETIRPMVGPETLVIPLQNGVEATDQLARSLGESRVGSGLCRIICQIVEPGHIRHSGSEPSVIVGERDNRRTARIEGLVQALQVSGIDAVVADDIRLAVWEKFLFITSASGIGAVTRMPIGVLREQSETRALLTQAMEEIVAVGREHGVMLSDDVIARTLSFIDRLPAQGTMSMQRDLMEGRRSELDAQNGAVVRLGRSANVPTPLHTFIYHVLLPMERQARSRTEASPA
ncbi:MAG: 2-dehydropantoate 2-reductase [Proteobacteria bacterium]|nr:2-dehydropantoate 2-reductase [Pseudomonadota bacterium]